MSLMICWRRGPIQAKVLELVLVCGGGGFLAGEGVNAGASGLSDRVRGLGVATFSSLGASVLSVASRSLCSSSRRRRSACKARRSNPIGKGGFERRPWMN